MSNKFFYAVKIGKIPGIYNTWDECKNNVLNFPGAIYKKFKTYEEATSFINNDSINIKERNNEQKTYDNTNLSGLHAYIDGSFSNSINKAGYGAVILVDGIIKEKLLGTCSKYLEMRNVVGELYAAAYAINWALDNQYTEITLHYDYTGIENWATGNWKTEKEGTKEYKKFIDSKKELIRINFVKVKSHSGDQYNDLADALAKEAIEIQ